MSVIRARGQSLAEYAIVKAVVMLTPLLLGIVVALLSGNAGLGIVAFLVVIAILALVAALLGRRTGRS
jgi:hypothetical protein